MERAVLLTGIGGQGVQLAAQVLAVAALEEGRDVQLFGSYGGMMRGGNTDATVVLADTTVQSPPTVGSAWAALLLHHEYAGPVLSRVHDGGVVLVNSSVWEGPLDGGRRHVVEVAATALAHDAGDAIAGAMVMLGALSSLTGVVGADSLRSAIGASVPPYRARHVALNERAVEIGAAAVAGLSDPAWPRPAATGAPGTVDR